jgi:Cu(I)/Ag(I) efflux system periplasmic protein CusF
MTQPLFTPCLARRLVSALMLLGAAVVAAPATASDFAEGEVRKVDADQARLTLKHGEIKALDMPPMTMVFQVKDKALLGLVKPGDKVRFKAASEAGRFIVTEIEPIK